MYRSVSLDFLDSIKTRYSSLFDRLDTVIKFNSETNPKSSKIIEFAQRVNILSEKCFSKVNSNKDILILDQERFEEFCVQGFINCDLSLDEITKNKEEFIASRHLLFESINKTSISVEEIINCAKESLSYQESIIFSKVINECVLSILSQNFCSQETLITIDTILLFLQIMISQYFEKMVLDGSLRKDCINGFFERVLTLLIERVYREKYGYGQHVMFLCSLFYMNSVSFNINSLKLKAVFNNTKVYISSPFCFKPSLSLIYSLKDFLKEQYSLSMYEINELPINKKILKEEMLCSCFSKARTLFIQKMFSSRGNNHDRYSNNIVFSNTDCLFLLKSCKLKVINLFEKSIKTLLSKDDMSSNDLGSFLEAVYRVKILGCTLEEAEIEETDDYACYFHNKNKVTERHNLFVSLMHEMLEKNKNCYFPDIKIRSVLSFCLSILNCSGVKSARQNALKICWDAKDTMVDLKNSYNSLTLVEKAEKHLYIAQVAGIMVYYSIKDVKTNLIPGVVHSVFASIFPECFCPELSSFRKMIGMSEKKDFRLSKVLRDVFTMCD